MIKASEEDMTTEIAKTEKKPLSILEGPAAMVKRRLYVKEQWLKGRSWTEITQDLVSNDAFPEYQEGGQRVSIATLNNDIQAIRVDLRQQLEEQGETHAALAIARMEQVQAKCWRAIEDNEGDEESIGFDPVKYMGLIVKAQDSINRVTGVSSDNSGIIVKPKDLKMYTFIDMLPSADSPIPANRTIDADFVDVTDAVVADVQTESQPISFAPESMK